MIRSASNSSPPVLAVEARLATSALDVQIASLDVGCELEADLREPDVYRLDLCLAPRSLKSRLCYTDHWPSHRFEVPGRLFLVPPGQTIRARSGMGRERLLLCRLQAESVRRWCDNDETWTRSRIEASLNISSHRVKQLLQRLGQEARAPGFASAVLAEAIGVQIAIELERYYSETASASGSSGLASWRLRLIEERLHVIDSPPTLSELAALCDISVRQLARGFKAARGISIGKHVADVRLGKAKKMLATGKSVKSVAFAVGFQSVTSFCFAFRNATGLAPREYQNRSNTLT